MSRIGRTPVVIPKGVTLTLDKNRITVKGPHGQLEYSADDRFLIAVEDGKVRVSRPSESKKDKALHGLIRTQIKNMIIGVTEQFTRELEVVGVGYKFTKEGTSVKLNVGYSHPVVFHQEPGIEFDVKSATNMVVKGIDKCQVGQMAANIRGIRPPEPYKGKGIKYLTEKVRTKPGKAGAK